MDLELLGTCHLYLCNQICLNKCEESFQLDVKNFISKQKGLFHIIEFYHINPTNID